MQEFLEQLRKLGPEHSEIRNTAITAANIIDRSLSMVEPIIVRAQQEQLRNFLALIENEISSGGSLERLREKVRRSPLFVQANTASFRSSTPRS
jgi:hypothetical protein